MNEPFHSPDFTVLFFFPRGNFGLCAMQHGVHTRHRVGPTKAERRNQLINRKCARRRKKKRDQASEKNSAHRRPVGIAGTVLLPARYFRVHWLHFLFGERSLVALWSRQNCACRTFRSTQECPQGCNQRRQFAASITNRWRPCVRRSRPGTIILFSPRTRAFQFFSQEIFCR